MRGTPTGHHEGDTHSTKAQRGRPAQRAHPIMWTSWQRCAQALTVCGHVNSRRRPNTSRLSRFAGHEPATTVQARLTAVQGIVERPVTPIDQRHRRATCRSANKQRRSGSVLASLAAKTEGQPGLEARIHAGTSVAPSLRTERDHHPSMSHRPNTPDGRRTGVFESQLSR